MDALNGFCLQNTSFPYVCVIIDDASTDGTGEAIIKYIQTYFEPRETSIEEQKDTDVFRFTYAQHKTNRNCFFALYQLASNHYQIGKSKDVYTDKWTNHSQYIALCEGDDYWISPEKLQQQVSFMDNHPSFSMTCNRTLLYSIKKNKLVGENYCYSKNRKVRLKDIIYRTGLFISTCSILYKKETSADMPDYWKNCLVGDYPLQIACALKGDIWYFNEPMSVYRIDNPDSWMGSQDWGELGANPKRLRVIKSQIKMFQGFSNDYPQYSHLFKSKISEHINKNIPLRRIPIKKVNSYLDYFKEEISNYSFKWKIDLFFRKIRIPYVRAVYQILFTRSFLPRNRMYK